MYALNVQQLIFQDHSILLYERDTKVKPFFS